MPIPSLLRTALNLINRHGIDCTYEAITKGDYDIDTQRRIDTPVISIVKAYRPMYEVKGTETLSQVNKTQSVILISGLEAETKGVVPKKGDKITYDGQKIEIDKVMKHWALGKVSVYRLFLVSV